jgi:hypothetical protein
MTRRWTAALTGSLILLPLVSCGVSTTSSPSTTTSRTTTSIDRPTTTPAPAATSPSATAPPATTSSVPPPPPPTTSPADIVNAYFNAINAGDYATAWKLGGDNFAGSYAAFVADFAVTADDSVQILATTSTTVTIVLNATQTDGSDKTYTGTYTVNGQTITGASIRQVTTAPPAAPAADLCGAPSNPYGYNLCGRGNLVTSPPADICTYFNCIGNFDNGRGYMVECGDGTYSMSGGIPDACAYHSGEATPVSDGQ